MIAEDYRSWFMVGSLALMLVAASPTLALFIHLPSGSERFSELWLLGPGHKAEDYPSSVRVNKTYSVYVGVGNRLGYSAYYKIFVKFGNQTQPLPVDSNATPSSLPELYRYDFFVRDDEVWENLLNFSISDINRYDDFLVVNSLSINEVSFRVGILSVWDVVRSGYYFRLFLELWLYNMESQSFKYHSRFVSLRLNVTSYEI